jgi:signal transduction histidine kinase
MEAKTMACIFEPFFTTKENTGTGLGLWIALEIVQKHRGSIRVRSRTDGPTTGTVFSMFVPYSPSQPRPTAS